jgi:hypothetical protein
MSEAIYAIVQGYAHPPTEYGSGYNGFDLRVNELDHAAKGLVGKPVYYEHKQQYGKIGEIIKAERTKNNGLMTTMCITNHSDISRHVLNGIQNKQLRSLSLGQGVNPNWKLKGYCTKIQPKEVSICSKPGREGSKFEKIYMAEPQNKFSLIQASSKMTEPNPESRIEEPAEATSIPTPPQQEEDPLERLISSSGLDRAVAAKLLEENIAGILEGRKSRLDKTKDILSRLGAKYSDEDIREIPDSFLDVLAAEDANYQRAEAERAALEKKNTQYELEKKHLADENTELKRRNAVISSKLLSGQVDRFIDVAPQQPNNNKSQMAAPVPTMIQASVSQQQQPSSKGVQWVPSTQPERPVSMFSDSRKRVTNEEAAQYLYKKYQQIPEQKYQQQIMMQPDQQQEILVPIQASAAQETPAAIDVSRYLQMTSSSNRDVRLGSSKKIPSANPAMSQY